MRTQLVALTYGFMVAGVACKNVILREPRVKDMISAENMIDGGGNIAFRSALIATCIEKVEGYDGAVTLNMLSELSLKDYNILVTALSKLEEAGEAEAKKE